MEKDKQINKLKNGVFIKIRKFFLGSKKRIIFTVIGLILLIFIINRIFGNNKSKVEYQTSTATKGNIISTVTESGNVAGVSEAGVGSPTTGIITDIFVKNGDHVLSGQNLFKVKSTATAQEIASAWAAYQNALVSANSSTTTKMVNQATLERDRAAILSAAQDVTNMENSLQYNPVTKNPYTQNEKDAIYSALTSARETFAADEQKYLKSDQGVGASNASVASAWLAYQATQDSSVTAPINGKVANLSVRIGDQITASGGNLSSNLTNNSSTATNAVLYIGDFSTPYIKVQATEIDVPNIHPGQKATITLSAFPNKTFVGNVEQVDSVGAVSNGVVTYNVFVSFLSPSQDIKAGMSANVVIQTARVNDVITVPSTAIQNSNGETTVRVLKNGQVTSVPVTVGISSDSETEITSGISEGETVVTGFTSSTSSSSTSSPFGGGRGIGGFGGGGNVRVNRGG